MLLLSLHSSLLPHKNSLNPDKNHPQDSYEVSALLEIQTDSQLHKDCSFQPPENSLKPIKDSRFHDTHN